MHGHGGHLANLLSSIDGGPVLNADRIPRKPPKAVVGDDSSLLAEPNSPSRGAYLKVKCH